MKPVIPFTHEIPRYNNWVIQNVYIDYDVQIDSVTTYLHLNCIDPLSKEDTLTVDYVAHKIDIKKLEDTNIKELKRAFMKLNDKVYILGTIFCKQNFQTSFRFS